MIEPFTKSMRDAVVALSLAAWAPVFESLERAMLPEVVHRRRLHATNYGRTHVAERDRNLLGVLRQQIGRNRKMSRQS